MKRELRRLNQLEEDAKDRSADSGPERGVSKLTCKFQHDRTSWLKML